MVLEKAPITSPVFDIYQEEVCGHHELKQRTTIGASPKSLSLMPVP
jgi:hypothetical protein